MDYNIFIVAKEIQEKGNTLVAHFLEYMREIHCLAIN